VLKRLILIYIGVFLIGSSLLFLMVDKGALFSYMVAFISSSIVILATFKSYENIVKKRLAIDNRAFEIDDRDYISKIEDPYNLDEDNEEIDLKEAIKEEKKRLKSQTSLKEAAITGGKGFSFNRIVAYGVLVAGFLFLLNRGYLNLYFYLPALIIPNLIAVIYFASEKK